MKTDYRYRTRLNASERFSVLYYVFPFGMLLVAAIVKFLGLGPLPVVLIVVIIITVTILFAIRKPEPEQILYFHDDVIVKITDNTEETYFTYHDILLIHLQTRSRYTADRVLTFSGGIDVKLSDMSSTGGMDINLHDFYKFLWQKNPQISITHRDGYCNYSYHLADGAVVKRRD